MLLLIDAGNTRIKWALADTAEGRPGNWLTSGSIAHAHSAQLGAHLADAWRALNITRVVAANVAGPAVGATLQQQVSDAAGHLVIEWFASQAERAGLRNGYRQPQQLGCDRFAAAIGARALYPDQPLIVATCGTATTIDAVSADGVFIGGMILPGLRLMASSLAQNTAQLPEVLQQGAHLPSFADNTEEAIITGCITAQVGAIERAVANHARLNYENNPSDEVRLIVSGGAAAAIAPHLAVPCRCVDNLVLIGLHAAFLHSQPPRPSPRQASSPC